MNLAAGARLGHYSIISAIGAGGMGEVYRAHDPRLDRDVAIKVLPAAFSADIERLRRFEQEARAAGALNHPNILVIHDVETREGAVSFVVMELLEGATLREELGGSPLPVRKAVDYALQITRGLAAAHEKGIIHRDLKPENLFVTTEGWVKILDFGIAKLRARDGSPGAALGQTEAATRHVTDPGLVIGTVGYMSPEQVRGLPVDHRSDLFSFGVVFYEMLTGRRAFTGESAVETLNAILTDAPLDVSESGTKIAPVLDKIVARCLEKKPDRRFQSASDLGFALEALTDATGARQAVASNTAVESGAAISRRGRREKWGMASTGVALLLAAGLAWKALAPGPAAVAERTMRFAVSGPDNARTLLGPMISPDGRHLAFSAVMADSPVPAIWMRTIDSLAPRRFDGTDGAVGSVIWSPDSRSFVFPSRDGTLKRIDIAGGPPRTVSRMANVNAFSIDVFGGTWGRDGTILYNLGGTSYRVAAAGGEPTHIDLKGTDCRSPFLLPDGRHFLCLAMTGQQDTSGIHLASLDGGRPQRLLAADSQAVYTESPSGQGSLLFVREGSLLAHPFDARSFAIIGEPAPVADRVNLYVSGYGGTGRAQFSVSDNGTLVYLPSSGSDTQQLSWLDRTGKTTGVIGDPDLYFSPRLSPDDTRLAVARIDAKTRVGDIYVIDPARGTSVRLMFDPGNDYNPVWSPDGRYIVWASNRGGKRQLLRKLASGVGQEELLRESSNPITADDWSPDGRSIIYRETDPKTNNNLGILPLDGDKKPYPFVQTMADEPRARFSNDGRLIGYLSNEFGTSETYVQTFPATGSRWQVSTTGGSPPEWRHDGKELYYGGAGKMWAVEVKSAAPFELGARRALFDLPNTPAFSFWSVTGDGQRFVFAVNTQPQSQTIAFTVVLNWAADRENSRK